MRDDKKPDNVVFNADTQKYDAYLKPYATTVGAPVITTTDTVAWKNRSVNNLNNKVNNLQAICADINQINIQNASIVVLNLTLQFIDVELRSNLIKKIYDGLNPGGVLIISEKIHFENKQIQNQITKLHMDFKRENGYSELEIANKRQAIENVLITETKEEHLKRLRDCGFNDTSCFFQCLNFVSFLSVK